PTDSNAARSRPRTRHHTHRRRSAFGDPAPRRGRHSASNSHQTTISSAAVIAPEGCTPAMPTSPTAASGTRPGAPTTDMISTAATPAIPALTALGLAEVIISTYGSDGKTPLTAPALPAAMPAAAGENRTRTNRQASAAADSGTTRPRHVIVHRLITGRIPAPVVDISSEPSACQASG